MLRKNQQRVHESHGRLKEFRELTGMAIKDVERIEQQIITLKETSKQDARVFESQLKDLLLAGEKRRHALEAQAAVQEKKTPFAQIGFDSSRGELVSGSGGSVFRSREERLPLSQLSEKQKRQEEDFRKLVSATGIDDVSELIESYTRMEEENFREFRYINEMTIQIAELEDQLSQLERDRQQLEEEVARNDQRHSEQQARTEEEKKSLEEQRLRTNSQIEELEGQLRDLLKEVCNLFYTIGADNLLEKTILKNEFIRIENFPDILRRIESRSLELIYAYSTIVSNVD